MGTQQHTDTKHAARVGTEGELQARDFLTRKGYVIVCSNYRSPSGEIDIIARDGKTLVFIEVKTRLNATAYQTAESVDVKKQKHIHATATHFLYENKIDDTRVQMRFDVIIISRGRVVHIKDAFQISVISYQSE